jgi:hypothetical protein
MNGFGKNMLIVSDKEVRYSCSFPFQKDQFMDMTKLEAIHANTYMEPSSKFMSDKKIIRRPMDEVVIVWA